MAVVTRNPKVYEKIMRVIKGEKGSPFKNVDDLGFFPNYRNVKDAPGTERKKLKEIGKKLEKQFKEKDMKMGFNPRINRAVGGKVCKLAIKGKGRAYGKNS